MINIKRLTENLNNMSNHINTNVLFEETFTNLKNQTGIERQRAQTNAKFTGIDQSKDGAGRTHWVVPSETNPSKSYDVVVEIDVKADGGFFGVVTGKWNLKKYSELLKTADVRVHCTCPDFYWSGMKYNLGAGGPHKGSLAHEQNSGVPEESYPIKPPDIRDPDHKNIMCKHLNKVWRKYMTSGTTIMSQARKYATSNDIVPVDPTITRDIDDGKATLEKKTNEVSVTEGDAKHIRDSLIQGIEQLEVEQNAGSDEILGERNDDIINTDTDELQSHGAGEFIDDENQEIPENDEIPEHIDDVEDVEDIESVKDQGTEDIIDDQNDVVIDTESEIDVDDVLPKEDTLDEDEDEDFSVKEVLGR